MPALSFKKQFRPRIEAGTKRHSIRGKRKRAWKVGDPLALYTGMRTKFCSLIFRTVVTRLEDIYIGEDGNILIEGQGTLTKRGAEEFARADGFLTHAEMIKFWRENNTLPFHGDVIHWKFPGEVR